MNILKNSQWKRQWIILRSRVSLFHIAWILYQSLLWSRAAAYLHAGRGNSVKADLAGKELPAREEEEEEEEGGGEKMQANPAYLPVEMVSYKSQESK